MSQPRRHVGVGESGAPLRDKFIQAETHNSNSGDYAVKAITTNGTGEFSFRIPDDFKDFESISLVGIVGPNAGGSGRDIDIFSDYAAAGEDAQTHSEADTTTTYTIPTDNEIFELEIKQILTNVLAGDYIGITVDHNSLGGPIDYLGIRILYFTQ